MVTQSPIYTEESRCQDCYKCVRNCPVKAIIIENGSARVEKDLCVYCGTCVRICPQGAKSVRNDIPAAERVLQNKEKVYAAVAPSCVSEFAEYRQTEFIELFYQLGFTGVSETALGAQEVSAEIARTLEKKSGEVIISPACPSIVEYVQKYLPRYGEWIAGIVSPVLAQCRMLKERYGEEIGIIFIGPCIAKKREADFYPEMLDAALTFNEFRYWLESKKLKAGGVGEAREFVPRKAREGTLYAIDGGMTAGIKSNCPVLDMSLMSFSGVENVKAALTGLEGVSLQSNLFLELLACEGGCINGPGASTAVSTIRKRLTVLSRADVPEELDLRKPGFSLSLPRAFPAVKYREFSPKEIKTALESVGKYSASDELDCSGCGYASCRDFAQALLLGKAERTMCVSYMRRIAQKESNKLLAAMPTAAVILDSRLKIIDCNRRFATILGPEMEELYSEGISLEGVRLDKYLPFVDLFKQVLTGNHEISDFDIKMGDAIFSLTIFPVEPHAVVGGILQDITEPVVQKERIINRAREVIRKNLSTAQQIASLLGENAADSETILNSIIKTFKIPYDKAE